jgi:hypothetical protein
VTCLVQITDGAARRVALVDEPTLRLIDSVDSVYALAREAMAGGIPLSTLAAQRATRAALRSRRRPAACKTLLEHAEAVGRHEGALVVRALG